MSIIAVAAMMLVSCKKDNGTDDNKGKDDNKTVETVDWSVIGSINGDGWTVDIAMTKDGDIYAAKGVTLAANDEFKIRYQKAWEANRGGTFVALGKPFAVENNGANIKPGLEGTYDIYYNAAEELMEITEANATPDWTVSVQPAGLNWDYVMNTSDYQVNCKIEFAEPLTINTGHMTMQWKFLSTKWNKYNQEKITVNGKQYTAYANRLGQLYDGDYGGEGILLRFGDGGANGSLRLNGGAIIDNAYVKVDNADYVWSLNEWHVLTIVADGTAVTVYDNDTELCTLEPSKAAHDWTFGALDLSETMDDGDVAYCIGQAFQGYTAFVRMWDVALTADQVKASLCDVPADSEGLKGYWAFNNDEGSVVEDLAGENDFNFKAIKSAADANGQKIKDNSAAIEAAWTEVAEVEFGEGDDKTPMPAVCAE